MIYLCDLYNIPTSISHDCVSARKRLLFLPSQMMGDWVPENNPGMLRLMCWNLKSRGWKVWGHVLYSSYTRRSPISGSNEMRMPSWCPHRHYCISVILATNYLLGKEDLTLLDIRFFYIHNHTPAGLSSGDCLFIWADRAPDLWIVGLEMWYKFSMCIQVYFLLKANTSWIAKLDVCCFLHFPNIYILSSIVERGQNHHNCASNGVYKVCCLCQFIFCLYFNIWIENLFRIAGPR